MYIPTYLSILRILTCLLPLIGLILPAHAFSKSAEAVNNHRASVMPAPKKIKNILIVTAMEEEASPMIQLLALKKAPAFDNNLPMKAYRGVYKNLNVYLIVNGKDPVSKVANVGTQPAVLSTYLGIKNFHPDLIMSIGTAGGLANQDAKIGDIYLSNKIYFYDRRLPDANYKMYGRGNYASPNTQNMSYVLKLKRGVVCSGDSFEDDKTDLAVLAEEGCAVKEMEAAGVAWVSMLEKIPMIALKVVTDEIDQSDNNSQFEKNFLPMSKKIAVKTCDILNYLSQGNNLS